MSLRTSTEIKADLDEARAARITALKGQSYTLDTGQGRQTVTRADLRAIGETIRELEAEYEEALARETGDSGIISATFRRLG